MLGYDCTVCGTFILTNRFGETRDCRKCGCRGAFNRRSSTLENRRDG